MKKLVLVLFVIISSLQLNANTRGIYQQNNNHVSTFNDERRPIKISVVLDIGRKSRNCRGFGICKVTITIELKGNQNLDFNEVNGILTNETKGKVTLVVPYDKTNKSKFVKETLSKEYFLVEEDFVMPDDVLKKLELTGKYVIKKGKYKINRTKEGYKIVF